MRWLVVMLSLLVFPNISKADIRLAHTGEICKTRQTLKKEHHSQRIYYEVINNKRCYHVHVNTPIKRFVSTWGGPKDASLHPYVGLYRQFTNKDVRGALDDIFGKAGP